MGILANVDESILNLNDILEDGFVIKKISAEDCETFISLMEKVPKRIIMDDLITRSCYFDDNVYCVFKSYKTETIEVHDVHDLKGKHLYKPEDSLIRILRLMRLFQLGNICMPLRYSYSFEEEVPVISSRYKSMPYVYKEIFKLDHSILPKLNEFIKIKSLPPEDDLLKGSFKEVYKKLDSPLPSKSSLELAFESFELSYEIRDNNLSFLTLMNALEVLLKPSSAQIELTNTLSRNGAVLLGKNKENSNKIFRELKCLYAIRSSIVHTGEPKNCKKTGKKRKNLSNFELVERFRILRGYVRESIKEMNFIMEKEEKSKDEILNKLNTYGFGQRPWREDK